MNIAESINLASTGMAMIFLTLILLITVLGVMSKFLSGGKTEAKESPAVQDTTSIAELHRAPKNVPQVESGITPDVVAVISASVRCAMGSGQPNVAIRSIKRAPAVRNAWSQAGLTESTCPF